MKRKVQLLVLLMLVIRIYGFIWMECFSLDSVLIQNVLLMIIQNTLSHFSLIFFCQCTVTNASDKTS